MNTVFSRDDGTGRNASVFDQSSSAFEGNGFGNGFFCGGFSTPRAHPSIGNREVASTAGATTINKRGAGFVDPMNPKHQRLDESAPSSTSKAMIMPGMACDSSDCLGCDADRLNHHSAKTVLDSIDDVDFPGEQDAVAEALFSLSCHERDRTFQEVHGVADLPFEDDKMVQTSLHEMEQAILTKISKTNPGMSMNGEQTSDMSSPSTIIQQAVLTMLKQNKKHAHTGVPSSTPPIGPTMASQEFLLQFLRSEEFNVEASSAKFLRFLEEKLDLFGADKLLKDITLDDMNEEDMGALNSGIIQRIPQKDRSGRDVVAVVPALYPLNVNHKSLVRAFYYVLMSTIMSQMHPNGQLHSRRQGLVQIAHRLPKGFVLDRGAMYKTQKLRQSLPFRYASVHIFTDDPTVPLILGLFRRFLNSKTLSRIQMHCGT